MLTERLLELPKHRHFFLFKLLDSLGKSTEPAHVLMHAICSNFIVFSLAYSGSDHVRLHCQEAHVLHLLHLLQLTCLDGVVHLLSHLLDDALLLLYLSALLQFALHG